jgi:hypothetical protein
MYIVLISVSAAAALVVISVLLLRCASFPSSFLELVLAPCGLLALFFSISPLALSPLLSVVVGYRPPFVSRFLAITHRTTAAAPQSQPVAP